MTLYDDDEAIPLEDCPFMGLDELPIFLQRLALLQQDSEQLVIKFLSRVSQLSQEERVHDEFLTFVLIKHKAILASIERQLTYWLSQTLTPQEKAAIDECQEILVKMRKAQIVFEDYGPSISTNYH